MTRLNYVRDLAGGGVIAAHGRRGLAPPPPPSTAAWLRHRPRALRPGRRGYCASSTFACNSSVTISVFELASLELQRFWALLKVHAIELHAEFLLCVSVVTRGSGASCNGFLACCVSG